MKNTAEVEVTITHSGTYHVGALTRGWTKDERALLDTGDAGAIDALREAAAKALHDRPGDSEMFFSVVE